MNIEKHFQGIKDTRDVRKIMHPLTDIIGLAVIAAVCGCDGYRDIEEFGKSKEEWLGQFLKLPNGIPSEDTISRVLGGINPKEFNICFEHWVRETFDYKDEKLLHIDGKSNRRSFDSYRGKKMLHSVSVFASKNRLSLAQIKVEDKSNEITAIEPLLEPLDIKGQTVTIDAMGCQKNIAETIVKKEGHYVLAVKDNQKALHQEIHEAFKTTVKSDIYTTISKDHGRIEERTCSVINDLRFVDEARNWLALSCIICIVCKRTIKDKTTSETRYYISDLDNTASYFLHAIRSHWAIENSLHWVLDVVFREDYCRKRNKNSAENFCLIRKMALNIIRNYKGDNKSIRTRRLNAAWDNDYLTKIMNF